MTLMRLELAGISSGGGDCEGSFFRAWLITLSADWAAASPPPAEEIA